MKRRDFLKNTSSLALGAGLTPLLPGLANAGTAVIPPMFPTNTKRVLINITLNGGPDFRHMLPPAFTEDEQSYGFQYWQARATSHSLNSTPEAFNDRWMTDFESVTSANGTNFGFLNSTGWLKDMWDAGDVAIVNNGLGSNTRDHSLGLLVWQQGDLTAGPHDLGKPGWGGRLASVLGQNIIAATSQPRAFTFNPDPNNPLGHTNERTISFGDSRNLGLFTPDGNEASMRTEPTIMSRSLSSYYAAKRNELSTDSPYFKFIRHEQRHRELGAAVRSRLEQIPIPPEVLALSEGNATLNNASFGRQVRNIYDAFAASDILDFQIMSMEYGGWDTHKNQKRFIEQRLADLFGDNQGLNTLYNVLPADVTDNLIIVIGGEFGRQLRANGDLGTDHGRGNNVIVIGRGIRGEIYGDMFPDDEIERYMNGRSADIIGRTSIEHIFGAASDWMQAGAGDMVFPNRASAAIEDGVSPNLFLT